MQPNQPNIGQPNLDFTQPVTPVTQPVQPIAPPLDPNIAAVQASLAEIQTKIDSFTPPAPVTPQVPEQQANLTEGKKYDEWGSVFEDVRKEAQEVFRTEQAKQEQARLDADNKVNEQEQANQQYIDNTLGQLRQAGFLPQPTNQLDPNDPGKQAENELIGYAVNIGSSDLVKVAQELKFRHDAGYKFDYQSKQFVQTNQPNPNDPSALMFGNPQPEQFNPTPVGPQNPYMPKQYPVGFNAPVSSGNTYQGVQGQVPSLRALRTNSYDSLVENFNRTQ